MFDNKAYEQSARQLDRQRKGFDVKAKLTNPQKRNRVFGYVQMHLVATGDLNDHTMIKVVRGSYVAHHKATQKRISRLQAVLSTMHVHGIAPQITAMEHSISLVYHL